MKITASFLALLLPLQPCAAFAHAMLMHAAPGAGAVLHKSPTEVSLEFSEQLEPAFSGAAVTGGGGQSVVDGSIGISGMMMTVRLKPLPAGQYRVQWHAVSVDTHRTEGTYSFSVAR